MSKKVIYHLGPLLGGIVFAIGLGLSGMLEPKKIVGFLDLFGDWDPTLVFVMGGAVGVHMILYRLIIKRESPLFDVKFHLPSKSSIDAKLVAGALLFGVGWAITGICPGPGIVAFVTGHTYVLVFLGSMLLGTLIAKVIDQKK